MLFHSVLQPGLHFSDKDCNNNLLQRIAYPIFYRRQFTLASVLCYLSTGILYVWHSKCIPRHMCQSAESQSYLFCHVLAHRFLSLLHATSSILAKTLSILSDWCSTCMCLKAMSCIFGSRLEFVKPRDTVSTSRFLSLDRFNGYVL